MPRRQQQHRPFLCIRCLCCPQPVSAAPHTGRFPPNLAAGGGRGGSRAAHQVCYLFHPFQPFLLTVVQDMESGQPERVTAFARLA